MGDAAPTTEQVSPVLTITGALAAALGALGFAIGLPLVITADETLNVCYQSHCREVDVTDTTQRDVGLGLAIPGAVLVIGGAILVGLGSRQVQSETKAAAQGQGASYLPDLVLLPFAGKARWRF